MVTLFISSYIAVMLTSLFKLPKVGNQLYQLIEKDEVTCPTILPLAVLGV